MPTQKTVTLVKTGNFLLIDPTDDVIFQLIKPHLSFDEKTYARGYEATKLKRQGRPLFGIVSHTLFELDHRSRIATSFGFWKIIRDALRAAGYTVKLRDVSDDPGDAYELHWNNIRDVKLRASQDEFLRAFINNRCGRFDCPPGYGKTFMLCVIAALYPRAQIDIVSRRVAVLRDNIYMRLVQAVADVGIVGGNKKIRNKRVMCYTAKSMPHSPATADILILDECHELASDVAAAELMRWQKARIYGLSASHDLRQDNKDLRIHGICGPIIFKADYGEALAAGMVVPIVVKWRSVVMDYDPCGSYKDIEKKRHGFWTNTYRNACIAEDARMYDEDTQVLITVETIQHAMNLKKLLPEFTLVYMDGGLSSSDKAKYVRQGMCSASEPVMDLKRKQRLTSDFEKGKLKKVICTTVWNVGVSFNNLPVLIRADGGSSEINSVQIPGRVSRTAEDKEVGIVHDYLDQFNYGYNQRAKGRAKSYAKHRWEQVFPRSSMLQEYLE